MSCKLILFKRFFFSHLIKLTQRLCCLLYTFLSTSLFVFKNLFQKFIFKNLFIPFHDFFLCHFIYEMSLICTNISLLYWSMSLNSFIKCCFEKIKLKVVVFRGHLRSSVLNISHKHLTRKMFIAAVCDNGWLLFLVNTFITVNVIL